MLDSGPPHEDGAMRRGEIAARQQASRKYLEHLLAACFSASLVRRVHGAQGGHTLTKGPDQIKLGESYDVFEGRGGFVEGTT